MNHPERIKDFGWRAIHETAVAAKRIVRDLTAHSPGKSYFIGCSDGGREALMMAQRYQTYFDGIVAGAPATAMIRLFTGGALRRAELGRSSSYLPHPQLALLQQQALRRCGDGAPFIKDPRLCRVDLGAVACGRYVRACSTAPGATRPRG